MGWREVDRCNSSGRQHASSPAVTVPAPEPDPPAAAADSPRPGVDEVTVPATQVVGAIVDVRKNVLSYRSLATERAPRLTVPLNTVAAVRVSESGRVIDFDRVGAAPLTEVTATTPTALVRPDSMSDVEWANLRRVLTDLVDAQTNRVAPAENPARPQKARAARKPRNPGVAVGWIAGIGGALLGGFIGNIANGVSGAIILGVIAGVGFGLYFAAKERKEHAAVGQSHTGSLGGVTFTRDRISYAGESQPIAGAHVEVLTSGQISRRFDWGNTITGAVLFGPVGAMIGAGEKKSDDRELYLVIVGAEKQWAAKLNPKDTPLAHGFAAAANTAAMAASKR